jgi:hypothetical protein
VPTTLRDSAVQLIYVHGIGAGPHRSAMEVAWTESLARGMTRAGHGTMARRLQNAAVVEPRMAHYGPLYAKEGAQGLADAPKEDDALLLHALVAELVDEMGCEVADPVGRRILAQAQAQLRPEGTPQGLGNLLRCTNNAVCTLMNLRPIRAVGQWTSAQAMIKDLSQVTRYMERREVDEAGLSLDQRIRAVFDGEVGTRPAIVVAHSLGTVVTLESLHRNTTEVPLLVTLGSPLGMRTVVLPRLRPQPPSTPDNVREWLNFWDPDDVVVARRDLAKDFGPNVLGVSPRSQRVDSPGRWTHPVAKYLEQEEVADPIAKALDRLTSGA